MVGNNSFEKFGIHNNAERYSWVAYNSFVCLSSLFGDSLILYASFQKDTFKMNKFIVAIIQHIAVCDLAYAISSVLPLTLSLIANSWVLGEAMCYARVYLGHFIYPAGLFEIAFLTTSKMLLLRFPIRCSTWTAKRARVISCITTTSALTFPLLLFVMDRNDIWFDYRFYTCDYQYSNKNWEWLKIALTFINHFTPNTVIVATTIPTLRYLAAARKSAKRVRGSVPWQGAITVALTAIVSCISNIVNFTVETVIEPNIFISLSKEEPLIVQCTRVGKYLLFINIMSNFYIYCLTIKSFRRFLRERISSYLTRFSRRSGNNANIEGNLQQEKSENVEKN
ncbi:hypothetical protein ACHWQZ_G010575 [Mnemiopsis leidyi]